ncbi:MAG: hypothetical protein FXV80_06475, partial [Candidatus Thioglobus sp.]
MPTIAELKAERDSWSSADNAGAFAANLNFPLAGYRLENDFYLTGSVLGSTSISSNIAQYLFMSETSASVSNVVRGFVASVRCILNVGSDPLPVDIIASISIANQTREIAENIASGTVVGEPLTTTGNPTVFSIIAGNTGDAFAIDNTGQITVVGALDYETVQSYTLIVQISKDAATDVTAAITINIANTGFTFDSIADNIIAENTAFSITFKGATDTALSSLGIEYTLGGADASSFNLTTATNVITITHAAFDFENPADSDTDNVYELTVSATDQATIAQTIDIDFTVTITDVEDIFTFNGFEYSPITSITGRIWLDKNLGANRVATAIDDADSFGDYYQWGRPADGHQLRNAATSDVLVDSTAPNSADFI